MEYPNHLSYTAVASFLRPLTTSEEKETREGDRERDQKKKETKTRKGERGQ